MSQDMAVVDLDQQFIHLGGVKLEGFGNGDAVTIEFDGPAYTDVTGADGLTVRSKNYNRNATMKVRLLQAGAVNDLLTALFKADYKSSNGAGVVPFLFEDGQGTTLLKSSKAYISAPPNITIAQAAQPREWTVRLVKLDGVWGSN